MAQVNLQYLKGVRTRFFNVLDREVNAGVDLLETDTDDISVTECKVLRQQVSECKSKINTYIDKLSNQSEKLAQAVGDSDDELTQRVIEDDSSLSEKALSMFYKLQRLDEDLKVLEETKRSADEDSVVPDSDESVVQKMCDFQMKLQQEFFTQQQNMSDIQMKMQHKFLEKQTEQKHKPTTAVKLPKIDIISFSGNRLQWIEFWDSFESAVDKNDKLSPIDKFNYLKGKLSGEARSAIAGLSLSNENYSVAIGLLKERFGDRQDIVDIHYKKLMNLFPARNTTDSLRAFTDQIERHLRSLEVLNENLDQQVFVSMIRSKIPSDVLLQLELLKGADHKWTLRKLRDLLRQYIVSKEKADKIKLSAPSNQRDIELHKFQGTKSTANFKGSSTPFTPKYTTGAFVASEKKGPSTQSPKKCRFCEQSHWSDQCDRYKTIEDRKRQLKRSCFKCLKSNHMANDCKSSKVCVYCGKENVHHRSLCEKRFPKNSGGESVHLSDEVNNTKSVTEEVSLLSYNETVLMQTALTEIKGNDSDKSEEVRLILDSGSHRTYITQRLAERLHLKVESEQEIHLVTFGSEKSKRIKTKSTKVKIKLKNGKYMTMETNIVPSISGAIQRHPVKTEQSEKLVELTRNLTLADTLPKETESHSLDILIGNDYYFDIIESEKIEVKSGLYLISSKLGWILSGRTQLNETLQLEDSSDMNMLILTHGNNLNESSEFHDVDEVLPIKPNLEDFWNIESIGIVDEPENTDDEIAMQKFQDTLKRQNGRYQVTWPWKDDIPDLPENRGLAMGRLKSLVNKIQKQPDLMKRYDKVIQDQLDKGVIEKVDRATDDGIRHYIPHHVVIKPDRDTTKLRVVYDASAKVRKEDASLNECLYRGPVLLRDLCGMLLRFRLPNVGIVADIEKAFLQVELQPSERDVTRFLWFKNADKPLMDEHNIQELRFRRVPFGVISSPFLLGATIECHLNSYGSPLAEQLKENIYMDNVITGTDTQEEAISVYQCAKSMFSDAQMNLREWRTNSEDVNGAIAKADLVKDVTIKVLGHTWNSETDTLAIQKSAVLNKEMTMTKRNVLRQVASVFDPLGLFAPVTVRGKVLLQNVWRKHLEWDEAMDSEDTSEWLEVKSDLLKIENLEINRCVSISKPQEEKTYKLVCFCDASGKAYAASVYLLQETENATKSDLMFCKTRLAPVKSMTIPRLELLAVLIGVRCVTFVEGQLKLPLESIVLMTDSQCVLQWISAKKKLPVFIENRVKEIRQHGNIDFRYVSTKTNPADIASRGCTVAELSGNTLWWHGPTWIQRPVAEWPTKTNDAVIEGGNSRKHEEVESDVKDTDVGAVLQQGEMKQESVLEVHEIVRTTPFGINEDNYSSLTKLIRVTAWCQRFVKRTRGKTHKASHLTSDELNESECMWQHYLQKKRYPDVSEAIAANKPHNIVKQLDVFVDERGMLRCGGRLQHANLSEAARFPILLPPGEKVTDMFIERAHKRLMHSGVSQTLSEVRQQFWIPCGRATVRKVLKVCKVCQRAEGGSYKLPPMAPLPKARVSESTPFTKVGIDYLGPLYVKETKETQKVWVCLFTCLATRAVHLELVQDMSTNTFLLCFRRFVAIRGTPEEIISDNAKQFKLSSDILRLIWRNVICSEEIQNYASNKGIKWSFIVELAPWMGGFYERLVGLVKRALRKTIGRKLLSLEQMSTLLKECEAVVNSRPLVYIGDDLKSSIAITPGHFISLNPNTGIPETECDDDPEYKPYESNADKLLKIWKKGQRLLDSFWQIWRNEYLLSLRERSQYKIKAPRVQYSETPSVGDVVLIKDDVPRGQWKMGKVATLRTSRDGLVRSAEVRTSTGKMVRRPINLLFPIEVTRNQ